MKLRVLLQAEEELAEAAVRYDAKRAGLGVELVARSFGVRRDIGSTVLVSAVAPRSSFSQRKWCSVFLTIVAIAHGKRKPGYWNERVE